MNDGGEVSRVEVITKVAEVLRQAGMNGVQVRGEGKRKGRGGGMTTNDMGCYYQKSSHFLPE